VDGHLAAALQWQGHTFEVGVGLVGRHNLDNVMAASTCALLAGVSPEMVAAAFPTFRGVRRRLEVVADVGDVIVVDDFAHHPTAVGLTLEGARHRFPGRRLVAVFEPRSLTAGRAIFASAYETALGKADLAIIAPVFHRARIGDQALDRDTLLAALRGGGHAAEAPPEGSDLAAEVRRLLRPGDVVVCMSSGDFGGLPGKLSALLRVVG
jgi:UDP-N-acetylmuramate: L-alanyl-gamma-D-glutamyl-meso-diaminopimelate ligase